MIYDVAIIGAGPGGIYSAYNLKNTNKNLNVIVIDSGKELSKRKCPMTTKCLNCKTCSIMQGFGGAGAFSDGKFNITNGFGGYLWKKVGKENAINLMKDVDAINKHFYGKDDYPKLYSSQGTQFKRICLEHNLHLLDADIRHLGTDKNFAILSNIYSKLVELGTVFLFEKIVDDISKQSYGYELKTGYDAIQAKKVIVSVGRSGSEWLEKICSKLKIKQSSNRVDIGVRVELPYETFSHLTDKLYESKIVYKTSKYEDCIRTFCMNPKGIVVGENTNGVITVNGHSFEDENKHTNNTNFALLVTQEFTEPFNSSNEYGRSIAGLSNMLGNGVIVQRYGDLKRFKRTTASRLEKNTVIPTLKAETGDLSLVLPHRILEDIVEMIEQLDYVAPGTKNDDTLLYGVEVKFYNNMVNTDDSLLAAEGLYIIGDGSGLTHSLSQAAASGLYVAEKIMEEK